MVPFLELCFCHLSLPVKPTTHWEGRERRGGVRGLERRDVRGFGKGAGSEEVLEVNSPNVCPLDNGKKERSFIPSLNFFCQCVVSWLWECSGLSAWLHVCLLDSLLTPDHKGGTCVSDWKDASIRHHVNGNCFFLPPRASVPLYHHHQPFVRAGGDLPAEVCLPVQVDDGLLILIRFPWSI